MSYDERMDPVEQQVSDTNEEPFVTASCNVSEERFDIPPYPTLRGTDSLLLHPGGDQLPLGKLIEEKLSTVRIRPSSVDDRINDQAVLVQQNRRQSSSHPSDDTASTEPEKLLIDIRKKKSAKAPMVLSIARGDKEGSLQITDGSESTEVSLSDGVVITRQKSAPKVKFEDEKGNDESSQSQNRGEDKDKAEESSSRKKGMKREDEGQDRKKDRGRSRDEGQADTERGGGQRRGRSGERNKDKDTKDDNEEEGEESRKTKSDSKRTKGRKNVATQQEEPCPVHSPRRGVRKVLSASELSNSRYKMFDPTSIITITRRGDILSQDNLSVEIAEKEDPDKRRPHNDGEQQSDMQKSAKKKKGVQKRSFKAISVPVPSNEPDTDTGFLWSALEPPPKPKKAKRKNVVRNLKTASDSERHATAPQYMVKRCRRHNRDYIVMVPDYASALFPDVPPPVVPPTIPPVAVGHNSGMIPGVPTEPQVGYHERPFRCREWAPQDRYNTNMMPDARRAPSPGHNANLSPHNEPVLPAGYSSRMMPSYRSALLAGYNAVSGDLWGPRDASPGERPGPDFRRCSPGRIKHDEVSMPEDEEPKTVPLCVRTLPLDDVSEFLHNPSRRKVLNTASARSTERERPPQSPSPSTPTVISSSRPKDKDVSEMSDTNISEEPVVHIRITTKPSTPSKTKPSDNEEMGDSPSRMGKKDQKIKKGKLKSSKKQDDDAYDEVQAYVYHGYQTTGHQKKRSSKHSSVFAYQTTPRRTLSLDAKYGEPYLHEGVQSTTAILRQQENVLGSRSPLHASGSSPLPEQREPFKARLRDKRYVSSTTLIDAPRGSTHSLLEPSIQRVPYLNRIVVPRRAIAYPSLVLVAVGMLVGLAATFLPSSTIQLTAIHSRHDNVTSAEDTDACQTTSCLQDGTYLKSLISWELDPCDDFYRFICSRWKSAIASDEHSVHDDLTHILETKVMHLLHSSSYHKELLHARAIFRECLNTLGSDDWSDVLELLWMVTLDGFPFSTSSAKGSSVWKVAARVLRLSGTQTLVKFRRVRHPFTANRTIIAVSAAEPLSPHPNSMERSIQFYNSTAFAAITALKKQRSPSVLSLKIARFAAMLEGLTSNRTSLYTYQRVEALRTIPELSSFVSELDLSDEDVLCPKTFNQLLSMVNNADEHTVLNYIGVRLMVEMAAFAPRSGSALMNSVVHSLYGRPRPFLPRWKLCVRTVELALPVLFSHAVQLVYGTTTNSMRRHVEALVMQLERSLDKLGILDEASRRYVRRQLNETRIVLFRPSWLSNSVKLNTYFSTLPKVVEGQGMRSFYSLRSHTILHTLQDDLEDQLLGSVFDRDCRTNGNTVYVPALMFNVTLVDFRGSERFQLPYTGTRVTQCLIQIVLRALRSAEKRSKTWWPDLSPSLVGSALLCLDRYRLEDSLMLLESTLAVKPTTDLFLEGNEFARFSTLRQYEMGSLFFVYYARGFCDTADSTAQIVNGPLWNNRAFQEAFHCAVGAPMNPPEKCPLWRD